MSDLYVGSDGFKPLLLPERGEDLQPGRQYLLTPLARLILKKEFGLANIPTNVECIRARVAPTCIRSLYENLETGENYWRVEHLEQQEATFRAFFSKGKVLTFTLDIKKMVAFAPYYDGSHKLPGDINKHNEAEILQLEEEWFKETSKYPPNIKLRDCSLRWWSRSHMSEAGVRVGHTLRSAKSSRLEKAALEVNLADIGF